MNMLIRFCAVFVLACSSSLAAAASEVIQLDFRMAEDVLPMAQSVLGSEGRASAYGNQLIVNASQDKIAELRSVLEHIDTEPRRLLITVDTQGNQYNSERGYQTDGTLGGRYGEVVIGQGEQQGRDQVRIIRNNTQNRDGSLRTVQALEGSAALVQVGQNIPQRSTHYGAYGQVQERTEYRSVNQGFYVTATVHGDNVQIEINSQNDRRSQQYNNVIDTQSTSSRVSGRLGEWINVSATSQDSSQHQDGFLQKRYSTGQEDSQLQIKVEVLN
ncbi:MAG: secretin [Pseudomonas sp.]|nr:secretin [Pseudomonas sp.]